MQRGRRPRVSGEGSEAAELGRAAGSVCDPAGGAWTVGGHADRAHTDHDPVARLPSGRFPANAAWLALAAICHNLTPRRRLPGRRLLRQSPRRDHPRPADRRRHPHRPSRPRPHHRTPARRPAPRDRLDEPVRSSLRPARRRGLTCPDPVSAQPGPRPPRPHLPAKDPDKPQKRSAAGKPYPQPIKITYLPVATAMRE
jgi:hypothetical protein